MERGIVLNADAPFAVLSFGICCCKFTQLECYMIPTRKFGPIGILDTILITQRSASDMCMNSGEAVSALHW
jgi:hypothetical protein